MALSKQKGRYTQLRPIVGVRPTVQLVQVLQNYMFLKKRKDTDIPSKFLEMGADTCLQFVPNITLIGCVAF